MMANGGVIAPIGLNMVALAAQRHAVPFVVLAGSHKVSWHCEPVTALCSFYPMMYSCHGVLRQLTVGWSNVTRHDDADCLF